MAIATSVRMGTRRTATVRRRGAITWSSGASANRVVAARMAGMTASDPTGAHPAAADEAVSLDRLLRVARARGLVPTARRQPREGDPVEPDEPDPDRLHDPASPPRTPPRRRRRRSVSTRVRWSAWTIAGRATIRTSQPG